MGYGVLSVTPLADVLQRLPVHALVTPHYS